MSHSLTTSFKDDLKKQLQYFEENITELLRTVPNFTERNQLHDLIREYRYRIQRYLEGISQEGPEHLVWIGSRVKVLYEFDGLVDTYCIVMPHEVNLDEGHISFLSPVGQSLLLEKVGSQVEIDSPSGKYQITITELVYGSS